MIDRESAEAILREALGPDATLREGQWEAIDSILNRDGRTLVVQRTGWGKSAVYFIATRVLRATGAGPTVVISPLLVLMRNQADRAAQFGVRAATINSDNKRDWAEIAAGIAANEFDLLLISPERLQNKEFRSEVLARIAGNARLVVIDEAHCISDWGHDFRPQYRMIRRVLAGMPNDVSVLCTTATANARVVEDLERQFGPDVRTIRGSLDREGLRLDAIQLPSPSARLAWLATALESNALPGSGIVYALTRRDAQRVHEWLHGRGIASEVYVGGGSEEEERAARVETERRLLADEIRVVVATQALGMGFDKPNLGWVVHYQRPGSPVLYYQQVGRAGRAVASSSGIVLCGAEDDEINGFFARGGFPTEPQARFLLAKLAELGGTASVQQLLQHANIRAGRLQQFLSVLAAEEQAPVEQIGLQKFRLTAVRYQHPHEAIERITAHRGREIVEMQEYANHAGCLMEFLRRRLDDPGAAACGRCARCTGEPVAAVETSEQAEIEAATFSRRLDIPIVPRKEWSSSRSEVPLPVSRPGWTWRIDEALRGEEGRALCAWSDEGYGRMLREDHGVHEALPRRYREDLVQASAELVRSQDRWPRVDAIRWVTVVPSRRAGGWLREFAVRLAAQLGLPFADAISDIRPDRPRQRHQENSFHQLRNLDDAFNVEIRAVRDEPVLLVDDCVDSRWTLTLLAAEMRAAGSGPVFPFALAYTGHGDA